MATGFGRLHPERRREIQSKGGRVAQARGTAHRWDVTEAQRAGRLGASKRWGKPYREPQGGDRRLQVSVTRIPEIERRDDTVYYTQISDADQTGLCFFVRAWRSPVDDTWHERDFYANLDQSVHLEGLNQRVHVDWKQD